MEFNDRKWLKDEFPAYIGKTLMRDTLDAYLKAEMLIDGVDTKRRITCSCQLREVSRTINDKYAQWRNQNT
jgi:hypothetical protein